MSIGVALSLLACVLWGISDFLGGLAARGFTALLVLFAAQMTGLVGVGVVIAISRPAAFAAIDPAVLAGGAAAGLADMVGYLALYQALRRGLMGVVAPISAIGVVIPVAIGVAAGGELGLIAVIGLVLAGIGGTMIAGADTPGGRQGGAIRLALLAAGGFGASFVFVAMGAAHDEYTTAFVMRAVSVPLLAAMMVAARRRRPTAVVLGPGRSPELTGGNPLTAIAAPSGPSRSRPAVWAATLACGGADVVANVCWGAGSTRAPLAIASMIGSLYPVVTVLLARLLLSERLCRQARLGAWACLIGAACLATGAE